MLPAAQGARATTAELVDMASRDRLRSRLETVGSEFIDLVEAGQVTGRPTSCCATRRASSPLVRRRHSAWYHLARWTTCPTPSR